MIQDGVLHPYVSIAIILLCAVFILTTGAQFFSQTQVCVNVPVTGDVAYNLCAGSEPVQRHYVPLPPLKLA